MNKRFKNLKSIIGLSSLGNLVLHLLHPSLRGGKRGCFAAFSPDFASSVLDHFGFRLGAVASCKDDKYDVSRLLQPGATTTKLPLDAEILLNKVSAVLGMFVSTNFLF